MSFVQNGLLSFWLAAATVWHQTNRRALPPTRLRANAAFAMGVMLLLLGVTGLLVGGPGTPSEMTAMTLTGPIYFIIAGRIRSLCPRLPT